MAEAADPEARRLRRSIAEADAVSAAEFTALAVARVGDARGRWVGFAWDIREFERISPVQRAESAGPDAPETVAHDVMQSSRDPDPAGRFVVLRPRHNSYEIDHAAAYPWWFAAGRRSVVRTATGAASHRPPSTTQLLRRAARDRLAVAVLRAGWW